MSRYDLNVLLYRLKKDGAFRKRFLADRAAALAGVELSDDERAALLDWNARRLNELGGALHLLLSIPDVGDH